IPDLFGPLIWSRWKLTLRCPVSGSLVTTRPQLQIGPPSSWRAMCTGSLVRSNSFGPSLTSLTGPVLTITGLMHLPMRSAIVGIIFSRVVPNGMARLVDREEFPGRRQFSDPSPHVFRRRARCHYRVLQICKTTRQATWLADPITPTERGTSALDLSQSFNPFDSVRGDNVGASGDGGGQSRERIRRNHAGSSAEGLCLRHLPDGGERGRSGAVLDRAGDARHHSARGIPHTSPAPPPPQPPPAHRA